MKRQGLTRRTLLGGALCIPAVHTARADCDTPALRIRVSRNFESFDPADAWGEDAIITRNLLAPLVRFKARQGSEEWGWERHIVDSISNNDPKRYEFKLRDEDWQGSSSISAEDVAFSFERIAGRLAKLQDAGNKDSWSDLQTVEITSSRTAVIALQSARADLLTTVLPGVAGCVVNKSYVEGLPDGRFTFKPGPTSGRYELCSVTPGLDARLKRDDSWKGDAVEIESAAFVVVENDEAAQKMWEAHELDVYRPNQDVLRRIVAQGQQVFRTSTSRTSILVLNQRGPLARPELRRAVQLAIDRNAVAQSAYADAEPVIATGLVPNGWVGWSNEQLVPFDPDEARRIAQSPPVETLRIAVRSDPFFVRIGEQVRSDLERIGIRSDVVVHEQKDFWAAIAKDTADILVTRTVPQTFGVLAPLQDFTSSSPLAWNRSPEFDNLFSRASSELSGDTILQMQRLLTNTGVVVPLVEDRAAYLLAENVRPAFDADGTVGDLGSWGRL